VPESPGSRDVEARIKALGDWRGETLKQVRQLIRAADPDVVEEVKWRKPSNSMAGVATWSHDGLLCTGEPYKDKVKLTFAHGAALPDPSRVFNGKDTGATRRSIDLFEGDALDGKAFKALVRAAVALNQA
jgi:hypothetical protein